MEEIKEKLKENNIHYKETDNLMIIFNNFNSNYTSPLHLESRSVVIDTNTRKIINYSCPTPLLNDEGVNYLMKHPDFKYQIYQCYEGTLMSLFKYENQWYLSTRKCLDASTSHWKVDSSHYDLFMEVLNNSGYQSLEELTSKLDDKLTYHFILLHYMNKNYVDYTELFGEEYKKLMLAYVRNQETLELMDIPNSLDIFDENILKSEEIDNISWIDNYNSTHGFELPAKSEGLILRGKNEEILIKIQSNDYQLASAVMPNDNLYLGLLKLYQMDKLKDFLMEEKNKVKFEKITNPLNPKESFYTIGIIDCVFKVLTTELFNLYNMLYDENAEIINQDLYQYLPNEYKFFLFKLRGINFKKNSNGKEYSVKDVYFLMKKIDVNKIIDLIRVRKLLYNSLYKSDKSSTIRKLFDISNEIEKVNMKLINIFTSKIFPEILPSDVLNSFV